jgi:hypothetical protein
MSSDLKDMAAAFLSLVATIALVVSPSVAQQTQGGAATGLQNTGQQAVAALSFAATPNTPGRRYVSHKKKASLPTYCSGCSHERASSGQDFCLA